jgi:hypothetical protein
MSRLIVSNIETQNIKYDSDTTAFTIASDGTTSGVGAGAMVKLLSVENNSSSPDPSPTYYDIDSTYINSTYDNYYLIGYFEGNADTRYLQGQVFVGGVVQTSLSYYASEVTAIGTADDHDNNNTNDHLFTAQSVGQGGEDGEGVSVSMTFQNANYTQAPFSCTGISSYMNNNGEHEGTIFSGSLQVASRADVVNGIRLKMHSGDLTNFKFRLYGIK